MSGSDVIGSVSGGPVYSFDPLHQSGKGMGGVGAQMAAASNIAAPPPAFHWPTDTKEWDEEVKGMAFIDAPPPEPAPVIKIVISQPVEVLEAKEKINDNCDEQCRVCQQDAEEPLISLGCRCKGDLAKVHRSCIDTWFRTRGSNKCEICQQVAVDIPFTAASHRTDYWSWMPDWAYGRAQGRQETSWFGPLCLAVAILVGGLLLDVLISVSFGFSALPANVVIGVLIVLGLGTALRLCLDCFREWSGESAPPQRRGVNLTALAYQPYHPSS